MVEVPFVSSGYIITCCVSRRTVADSNLCAATGEFYMFSISGGVFGVTPRGKASPMIVAILRALHVKFLP